tara:strand:+ start:460257 stop:460409 length:153 start_codon:yes stop_codon:yes gene_type:complete
MASATVLAGNPHPNMQTASPVMPENAGGGCPTVPIPGELTGFALLKTARC